MLELRIGLGLRPELVLRLGFVLVGLTWNFGAIHPSSIGHEGWRGKTWERGRSGRRGWDGGLEWMVCNISSFMLYILPSPCWSNALCSRHDCKNSSIKMAFLVKTTTTDHIVCPCYDLFQNTLTTAIFKFLYYDKEEEEMDTQRKPKEIGLRFLIFNYYYYYFCCCCMT